MTTVVYFKKRIKNNEKNHGGVPETNNFVDFVKG